MRTIHPTFTLCVAQEIRHVSFRRCRMARRGGQRGSCVVREKKRPKVQSSCSICCIAQCPVVPVVDSE